MKKQRKAAVCLAKIFVLLLTLSCALIPSKDETAETQAPLVIVVTATLAAAAEEAVNCPLKMSPCLYQSECPDAIDLDDELGADLKETASNEVTIAPDAQVKISQGWVAIYEATLQENLQSIQWFVEVDGVNCYEPSMIKRGTVRKVESSDTLSPGAWLGVAVKGWKVGEPHTIRIGYYFTKSVSDGWDGYPEEYMYDLEYIITPTESGIKSR